VPSDIHGYVKEGLPKDSICYRFKVGNFDEEIEGARKKGSKMSWLHAVCVCWLQLTTGKTLIYNRVCEPDDLQPLVDISDRVSATMKHLISFDTFNSKQMSKSAGVPDKKNGICGANFLFENKFVQRLLGRSKPLALRWPSFKRSSSRATPKGSRKILHPRLLKTALR
jgi:hypothetical protein